MEMTRENVREEIERVYQTSLMRKYWGIIGRGLARLAGRKGEAPAWVSFTVALVLVQVIATLIGIALKERTAISAVSFRFSYPMLVYVWLCMIIFQALVHRIIQYFRSDLVNALDLPTSQNSIRDWLHMIGRGSIQAVLSVAFILLMTVLTVFATFSQGGIPPSITIYVFVALVLLLIAPHLYWIFMIAITFAFSIRQWTFHLFPDDPSRTPVIQTMHQVSSNFLLTVALVLALNFILIIPLRLYSESYLISVVSVFWVPALLYFLLSESAFTHLLVQARLQRLSTLQGQIIDIENHQDVSQKEPSEAITRLLDLHDRVKSAPASMINLGSIANLLGSLALPLLGALISIFDIWQRIFGTP